MKKLILASGSPRRTELLTASGIAHTVLVTDADETPDVSAFDPAGGKSYPEWYTVECALRKLRAAADIVFRDGARDAVVVAADTVVTPDGSAIFGKPADRDDAVRMLRVLSGTEHSVVGGIAVTDGETTLTSSVSTLVRFKELTEAEIDWYADSGEPFGKAGAYAVQGKGALLVEGVRGDYPNIVGISVYEMRRLLARLGCDPISEEA